MRKFKGYWTFMSGHVSFGPITIYGRNAMHWGVTWWTKRWGYICFRLPFTCFGEWHPLYFYCSPNATPGAATFMVGRKAFPEDWVKSRIRRACLGHNFDVHGVTEETGFENYLVLRGINRTVSDFPGHYWLYQNEHPED